LVGQAQPYVVVSYVGRCHNLAFRGAAHRKVCRRTIQTRRVQIVKVAQTPVPLVRWPCSCLLNDELRRVSQMKELE
jgi:hypothetical protein